MVEITDCNNNGIDDALDISNQTSPDCNGNGVPDECDIATVCTADFQGLGNLGGDFSEAQNVSADGTTVVGRSTSAQGSEAFRWTSDGGMVGLGDLPGLTFSSTAWGCSADGSVVAGEGTSESGNEAFRWISDSGMTGLGDLPGGPFGSRAHGISADGLVVVGLSTVDGGFQEAFRWENDVMTGLGALSDAKVNGMAWDTSADGSVVVGIAESTLGEGFSLEAFRWENDVMTGLGDLPGGGFIGEARAVSADGSVVVGWSESELDDEAFIWDAVNGMRNLKDVLEDDFGLDLTGWTLNEAHGISADGTVIVGAGENPSGNDEAWVATLCVGPSGGGSNDRNNNGIPDECEAFPTPTPTSIPSPSPSPLPISDCNNNGIDDADEIASGSSCESILFTFDDDLEGWQTGTGGGELDSVVWLSGVGQPPGSVKLDGSDFGTSDGQANSSIFNPIEIPSGATLLQFDTSAHNRDGADSELRVLLDFGKETITLLDWEVLSGAEDVYLWETRTVDISLFAGQTATFVFEQGDNDRGIHEQRYIDNILIGCPQTQDCNNNGVPDECDITGGTSTDSNQNGIPDECEAVPTDTPMPSPTTTPTTVELGDCDSGLYTLLSSGGLQKVGTPPDVVSSLDLGDLGMDLERVSASKETAGDDLVILDGSGILHFAQTAGSIDQEVMFPPSTEFPIGRATDFQLTQDFQGAWVLTDFGGIYRAGTAKDAADPALVPGTDQMGVLGYDVDLAGTMRREGFPDPGGATLRAVGIQVIDIDAPLNRADGYIVLDSQGGHWQFNPDGSPVAPGTYANQPANHPHHLLDPDSFVFPFFPGLDIARDVDMLHITTGVNGTKGIFDLAGIDILDGWGGIHPVPVNDPANPVFFTRNQDPNNPGTPISTVGMPYMVLGFDDPDTPENEANGELFGSDVFSIFIDFDFSLGCADGFYTLDKMGSVFAFGSTRATPSSLAVPFSTGPQFRAEQDVVNMQLFPPQR